MTRRRGEDVLRSVAANLRAARQRLDLTQADLAEKADLDLRQVQRAEGGLIDVGIVTLAALAVALEVTPNRLFKAATLPPPRRGRPPRKTRRRAVSTG